MAKRRPNALAPAQSPERAKSHQVFVSYATADKWLAAMLCEKIEQTGATTFRDDRDIDGGDDVPERLRAEIKRSKELVVLLTPESYDRPWVLIEVGAAWGSRKDYRIVAILCHISVEKIPDSIKSKKAFSLNDVGQYLDELTRRVRGRHG